jgi:hypothetical protein
VIKTANGAPIGYFGSLDYGFAFYSGRNIAFITSRDSTFDYVVCSENDYRLMWPAMRARFAVVLRSNPTDFDGSGQMLLLKRIGPAASSARSGGPPESAKRSPAPPAAPSATPTPGHVFDL